MTKIFFYEDQMVLINVRTKEMYPIEMSKAILKAEINEVIARSYICDYREIISRALKDIIGLDLVGRTFFLSVLEEEKNYLKKITIHESSYYQELREYIMQNEIIQKRQQMDQKRMCARKAEDKAYDDYICHLIRQNKARMAKKRRSRKKY